MEEGCPFGAALLLLVLVSVASRRLSGEEVADLTGTVGWEQRQAAAVVDHSWEALSCVSAVV